MSRSVAIGSSAYMIVDLLLATIYKKGMGGPRLTDVTCYARRLAYFDGIPKRAYYRVVAYHWRLTSLTYTELGS
ncbi:hypothetical protein [Desulfosporosinus sp. BICA1-9]|uniref:hypothetical protein n=1 Tax=Desulfosporosinus sp. BICA1-9 TaxID=1531958 RepID=UPI00054B4788|nr:hypothetical protein [Desulfosporosinus sp. BICA1-9]KJS48365.1 MAG: hypothetical protein VR66_14285 [Peptococcaceae bacterium BRH_c23]KJS84263.1 MAG: hypothetical protein JL57_21170 [Desulfosporosinus sp. BICA1-9]HBW37657.1 hypothetical protein [Desulfosporosinus sp.]